MGHKFLAGWIPSTVVGTIAFIVTVTTLNAFLVVPLVVLTLALDRIRIRLRRQPASD
jgi:riboflavin transporter FmnP